MGRLLVDILQNCVRMDGGHALACIVGFAMVWLLTVILQNYVIRMDVIRTIVFTMGCTLAGFGYKILERLYHIRHKKHQPIQASLQAYIHEQHMDAHLHSERHEVCLEVDAYCHERHKESK